MENWVMNGIHQYPNTTAIINEDTLISFGQIRNYIDYYHSIFNFDDNKKLKLVTICNTSVEFCLLIYMSIYYNYIIVPLNPKLTPNELDQRIKEVEGDYVLFSTEYKSVIEKCTSSSEIKYLEIPKLPDIRTLIDRNNISNIKLSKVDKDQVFCIIFSSGTTGRAKAIPMSYNNLNTSAIASKKRIGHFKEDRWLLTIPLFHIGGLSIVIRSLIFGTAIVIMKKFEEDKLVNYVEIYNVSLISLVPVMLNRILIKYDTNPFSSSLRLILLGGDKTPINLVEMCKKKSVPIAPTYGMSEASSQIATALPAYVYLNPKSVGKPLDCNQVRIIDEFENTQKPYDIGEIVVKGDNIIKNYLNQIIPMSNQGEFKTGDLGYVDNENNLYVIQRKDDMIISGGENIYPSEIEKCINKLSGINDVVVIGVDDEFWGQKVIAIVESELNKDLILNHCKANIEKHKVPKDVKFIDKIPRNKNGKINRNSLKYLFQ